MTLAQSAGHVTAAFAITAILLAIVPRAMAEEPDLRGIWQAQGSPHLNLEGHPAQDGFPAAPRVVIDPASGKIPYRTEALAKRQEG